jgi:hypothetical protein
MEWAFKFTYVHQLPAFWIFLSTVVLESLAGFIKGALCSPSDLLFVLSLFSSFPISQSCCHRVFCQVCCSSCLSSRFCCSFLACSLRKATDLFRGQRRAWVSICSSRYSFGRIWFRRINSWRSWFCTLIMVNFTITSLQYCIVCGRS